MIGFDCAVVCAEDAGIWIGWRSCVKEWRYFFKVNLNSLHQRIIVVISIYTVRSISNPIAISIASSVIIPVIAEVVCVCFALVGVSYF